ncbi:MAG: class B sortase [Lachnospiraceae bacterium]|nr:class B sortase [Lachnospiraceae bacterium]
MTSERRIIGGHRFTNEADYQAAERDLNKIEEIRKKIDFSNQQSLEGLYNDLQTGHITFESIIGQEFDDEVYEAYTNLKGKNGFVKDNIVSKTDKSQSSVKKTAKVKDAGKRISLDDFDEEMQARIVKELNKKERLRKGILITCGIIAACSLLYFAVYEFMTLRTNRDAQALAEAIKDDDGYYSTLKPGDDKYYAQLTETEEGTPVVLHKYEDLYNQNKSLIGWVKIADTVIDYPVMQTVNNEYYLDHNFHQEYDKNGSIFLDASCSVYPRSTNLIIYGHHMKSGKMFGSLQSYQNESYYKEHKYIQFDSIYETGTYEVMFVFRDKVYSQEDVNFKYYEFIDANSEEEFNSYMDEMASVSYYETGVVAQYGDQLLTLSTCDYQQDNGRFVVVARRVTE